MTDPDALPAPTDGARSRVSVDRLRERTDELELIISGLTTVALFNLPGWLFDRFVELYAHLPVAAYIGAMLGPQMTMAIAYALGSCFLLHLGVRAYWVSLIGLSAVFPAGIRWDQARGIGPINRERLRASVPAMSQAIANADRVASILFSVITLSALALLWLGLLGTTLMVCAAMLGSAIGATNAAISGITTGAILLVLGAALLIFLLDVVLANRSASLQQAQWFRKIVHALSWIVRVVIPERVIAPVRLTLQTNTWPRLFALAFLLLITLVPLISMQLLQTHFSFDPFGNQRFIANGDSNLRSPHYESLRQAEDQVRAWPMIPAMQIETAWLPLFLPYLPLRDDMILQQRCTGADAELSRRVECFAKLWQLSIDGTEQHLIQPQLSERRDLGYRGISGWLDLRALEPGPHELRVIWRPQPQQDRQIDDYLSQSQEYHVPFLWTPEFAAESKR